MSLHKQSCFYTPAGYGTEVADGKKFADSTAKCTLWNMLSMLTLQL
jgi:hypothetical protein